MRQNVKNVFQKRGRFCYRRQKPFAYNRAIEHGSKKPCTTAGRPPRESLYQGALNFEHEDITMSREDGITKTAEYLKPLLIHSPFEGRNDLNFRF